MAPLVVLGIAGTAWILAEAFSKPIERNIVNPLVYAGIKPPEPMPGPAAPATFREYTSWTPDMMIARSHQQFNEWKRIAFGRESSDLALISLVVGLVLVADRIM